ncbi:hypothetical protein TNCT_403351 [Trichonephila clavata]|uniref:Uncharacterized protein n=1 Tax=Trichonephila clavata TaxID=2740835 RepID=A0A8X6IEF4_TRICU|nr:hypothetical protein TNCT_403351 [Trichonephila clavata]
MPDERSQGPCRMEACVARQSPNFIVDLNHCFVVDGCIFCSEKVSCCPWTGWRHCCMRVKTCTVGNQFHCVQGFKHCIVILKVLLLVTD